MNTNIKEVEALEVYTPTQVSEIRIVSSTFSQALEKRSLVSSLVNKDFE